MDYRIDPELATVIPMLPKTSDNLAATRAEMGELFEAMKSTVDVSGVTVEDRTIPGPDSEPPIGIRLYRPEALQPAAIMHIHGGGFIIGSLDSEYSQAVGLARDLGVLVVSVDYRLAPAHPVPAAPEDCYGAFKWVHANANGLGIDPQRIALLGGSCGAGLAAAVALMARDRKGPNPCFKFIALPQLDDR